MGAEGRSGPVAEICCCNCGRILAEAIRDGRTQTVHVRPAARSSPVQVVVAGRRLLRCGHCGGRAFVEPLGVSAERRGALRAWQGRQEPGDSPAGPEDRRAGEGRGYGRVVRMSPLASRTRRP